METKICNRSFIFLIIGQASSMFGTILLKFTVSLLILDLTGSAVLFGAITAISYIPPVLLSPIGGILADRKNKRNLMVALDVMYGVMSLLLAFSLSFGNALMLITIITVGLSIVSSLETPVVQSSIPLIQPKDILVQSNIIVSQVNMLANLIGPLLAGVLYSTIGGNNIMNVQIIFAGCAALFFSAAILEIFIKIPEVTVQKSSNPLQILQADLTECFRFLTATHLFVFKAILLNAAFVLLIQPLITTGAPFIIRIVLNLSPVLNGLLQAFMGAAGLAGGVIAGVIANKFTAGSLCKLFLIAGFAIAVFGGALLLNLPAQLTYAVFVIVGVVIFISASISGIFIMSAIQQNVPEHMLGRVMAFYSAVMTGALSIGIFFYGYLYEQFIRHLHLILIFTAGAVLIAVYMSKKTYHRLWNCTDSL